MTRFVTLLAFAGGLAVATPFQNGGFEAPSLGGGISFTIPTDWVGGGAVGPGLFLETYSAFFLPTLGGEGVQAMGFGANGNSGQSIEQTFDTITGHMYQVSFQYVVQQGPGGFNEEWTFDALNGATVLFDQSQIFSNTAWVTSSFNFVAASTASTIRFTDISATLGTDHNAVNWALDAVNVTDLNAPSSAPEPSAIFLVPASLAAMMTWRIRRKPRSGLA